MAISGTKTIAVTSDNDLVFSWERISFSEQTNTSNIKWTLTLVSKAHGQIISSSPKRYSITVDGQTWTDYSYIGIDNNTSKTLASDSKVINHNADGTKTFNWSISQDFNITFGDSLIGTITGSGTDTLEALNKQAHIVSVTTYFQDTANPIMKYKNTAGNSVTLQACISIDGAETIPYRTISSTAETYIFNLTDAERKALRQNSKSVQQQVTFYLKTIRGSSTFYSTANATMEIYKGSPTLSPTLIDVGGTVTDHANLIYGANSTVDLTGNANIIIKWHNKVQYAINATARKEATIVSQSVSCGGITKTEPTGYFENADDVYFDFKATDSRGQETKQRVSMTVINYFEPTVNIRTQTSTTVDRLRVVVDGEYFASSFGTKNGNFINNLLYVYARYRKEDGEWSNWKTLVLETSTGNYGNAYSRYIDLEGLDYTNTYYFQAKVEDCLTSVESTVFKLKVEPIFDWGRDDFNFNVPVSIKGDLTITGGITTGGNALPTLIDHGTSGEWTYRKWSDGVSECWGLFTVSTSITTAWGSLYVGDTNMSSIYYPYELFIEKPVETVTLQSYLDRAWLFAESVNTSSASAIYNVCSPSLITGESDYYFSFYVRGRWK